MGIIKSLMTYSALLQFTASFGLAEKTWEKGFPDPYNLIIIVYYLSRLTPLPQTIHSMK